MILLLLGYALFFRPSVLKEKWDGAGESFGDVEMSVSDDSSLTFS